MTADAAPGRDDLQSEALSRDRTGAVFGHRELEIVRVPMAPEETFLANSAFRDVNHLTPSGARRSTRMLFVRLDEQGCCAEPAP